MVSNAQISDPHLQRWLQNPKAAIDALDRIEAEESLVAYVRQAWHVIEPGSPYIHGWHIDALAEHLEAITRGEIIRFLANVPPGMMKSLLLNVFWPTWEWGPQNMPHMRYVCTSHKQDLSIRDNIKARRLVMSDWYQERWGDRVVLMGDQNAKVKFETTKTGFREAMAFDSLTGSRGDRVLIDDPHNVKGAESEADRASAELNFLESVPTRVNSPEKSAIIVIMQRLHERDISGVILAEELGYEHLMLPMEFEPARRCRTSIGFEDPRKEDGELLFPERFPREVVERDKKPLGEYAVAGQFQQRPAPRGGALFKTAHMMRFDGDFPAMKWRGIYVDTAMKEKETADWSVFGEFGLGVDGRPYLLSLLRDKWEAPKLEVVAKEFWKKCHKRPPHIWGTLRSMKVEDKSSGTGLIQKLRTNAIPIVGIPRDKDKVQRGNDTTPYLAVNPLMISEDAEYDADGFINEVLSFPRGAHDDRVDVMMDAIADLLGGGIAMDDWV